jgi:hypothetical protein
MKNLLLLFLLALNGWASAQSTEQAAEAATAELAAHYQLDAEQRGQVYVIEKTRLDNLAAVEAREQDNSLVYWEKRKAIVLGEEKALERILRPDQRQLLQEKRLARRIAESELVRELKAQGYSRDRIRLAVLQRY